MANWLSITWENDRLMLLSARVHNGSATFDRAAVLKLHPDNVGSSDDIPSDSGELIGRKTTRSTMPSLKKQLEEYIRTHRLGKAETVVLLSRADVEVRSMLFPPVPADELPDLVKFQASKEFNSYDPSSPLDYFITNKLENVSRSTLFPAIRPGKLGKTDPKASASGGAPKHVLASTLRSDVFQKIQKFCDDLNLSLRRIVLRPCEAAYLLRRKNTFNPERTVLFVELDANETSQTVLFQGEPVFMRSPKISCPEDVGNPDFAARLVAELKRTRIAVRNEIQGVTVDQVVLCGVGKGFENLAAQVSKGLDVPVLTFDPWEGISCGGELKKELTEKRADPVERFVPLIGAAIRAGKGEASEIDFCNPKKRPEPVGKRQLITAAVATVFFLVLGALGYGYVYQSSLIKENGRLSNQKTALERTAKSVGVQRVQLKAIEDWLADDVNWFEQLGWLSRSAPDSRDMILNEIVLNANHGGSMGLKTLVRDSSIVSPMEERLRDDHHDVKSSEKGEVKGNPLYGFRFNLSVFLSKESAAVGTGEAENGSTPAVSQDETESAPVDGEQGKIDSNEGEADKLESSEPNPSRESPSGDIPPPDGPPGDAPSTNIPQADPPVNSPVDNANREVIR